MNDAPQSGTHFGSRSHDSHHVQTWLRAQEGQPEDFELRKAWPWWKVKKWTLHVAHRLLKRYGDARGLEAGSPERAFADLWRRHCSAQFLQAQLELLALVPAVRRAPV